MNSLKPFLLLLLGFLAACTTTSSLDSAANRLDNSAERFYEQLRMEPVARHSAEDAALLVDATHEFDRAVSQSRSRDYLRPAFDRVAERYHHLRIQLDDREYDGWHRRDGFASVTEAYLDVDRVMNYPESRYHD